MQQIFLPSWNWTLCVCILDTDMAMSPVMISLLVSGLTFVVATFIILIVFRVLSKRKRKLTELERESRTCKTCVCVSVRVCFNNTPVTIDRQWLEIWLVSFNIPFLQQVWTIHTSHWQLLNNKMTKHNWSKTEKVKMNLLSHLCILRISWTQDNFAREQ